MTAVPGSHTDLSPEWLTAVLIETWPDVRPTGRVNRIGAEYGFASEIYRCGLAGMAAPATVVAKLWSTAGGAGSAEVDFYRDLAPRLGIRVPRCHFAGVDVDAERGALVLEDISPATQGDALAPLDEPTAATLVSMLARLHVKWPSPHVDEFPWVPGLMDRAPSASWIRTFSSEYHERFGLPNDDRLASVLGAAHSVVADATATLKEAPATLIHRDLHADNMLLAAHGDPVIVDWAHVHWGPGALNVVDVVSLAGARDFGSLVDRYRAELVAAGVEVDLARLMGALRASVIWRIMRWTLGISRWFPTTARGNALLEASPHMAADVLAAWNRYAPELPI